VYNHEEFGTVMPFHHDSSNTLHFIDVIGRDNGGVVNTSLPIREQSYDEFLGAVSMLDYPDNWEQLRAAILDRDNYTCQGCGAENTELSVHHIVPLGCGGSNVKSNLITLCKECHGSVHGGVT
jgi:hypothetical protein